MSTSTLGLFLRHLALSEEVGRLGSVGDHHLLTAYESGRGQAAFAELMRRHGPMVLRTCRRILGQETDAEDAFQATFVLLARKAGSISKREALGGWLHRVAYRIALDVLAKSTRRRVHERQAGAMMHSNPDPVTRATWRAPMATTTRCRPAHWPGWARCVCGRHGCAIAGLHAEQGSLYQQLYNLAVAGNTYMGSAQGTNSASTFLAGGPISTPLAILACPSDQLPSPPTTYWPFYNRYMGVASYIGNYYGASPNDGVFPISGSPVSMLGITDGTSNTILFGERYNYDPNWNAYITSAPAFAAPFCAVFSPWGAPSVSTLLLGRGSSTLNSFLPSCSGNCSAANVIQRSFVYGSGHPQGVNFVFCDGSVHFLGNALQNNPSVLIDLSTRAGSEVVDESTF